MTFDITIMKSERVSTGLVHKFKDFRSLGENFQTCRKGGKLGAGFVRGALEGKRCDENCSVSNVLIIDGDKSEDGSNAPNPKDVSNALIGLGYNHFIYTSHSHRGAECNKFRVVIECGEYDKSKLDGLNVKILWELESKNIRICYVKEMKSFSQIWFSPRRDDPDDGVFEYYGWHNGDAINVDDIDSNNANIRESRNSRNDFRVGQNNNRNRNITGANTIDQMMDNIRTGEEFHESMLILSYQLLKEGIPKAFVKSQLRSYMNNSSAAGSDRWQKRYDEIDRMVDKCNLDDDKFDFNFEEEKSEQSHTGGMPKPPGLLGNLYDDAYGFLMLQYPEVAMASALGLVSGICGRKFNILDPIPSGLNMFLTIIASTGTGKDRINDFICTAIRSELKDYSGFVGPSHFYSPKAVVNSFKDNRSRVCVVSEAGLMMKVKSGNVDGLSAFILDAFQCSHSNGYTKAHSYSSIDNNMESLRGMAMTVISESSPDKMIEAYGETGALDSGLLPRQLLFKIRKRETVPNRRIRKELSIRCQKRVGELLDLCIGVQGTSDPKAISVVFDEEVYEDVYAYMIKYNEISASAEGKSKVRQHMATRVAQKAIRLSGICAVFNADGKTDDKICIGKQEWSWGKGLCDYEFGEITNALKGIGGSGLDGLDADTSKDWDKAVGYVLSRISQVLDDTLNNQKYRVHKRYRVEKIIPYGNLKCITVSNRDLSRFNDKGTKYSAAGGNGYRTGLDKVLGSMKEAGVIEIMDKDPLGGKYHKVIRIKEGIVDYAKMF